MTEMVIYSFLMLGFFVVMFLGAVFGDTDEVPKLRTKKQIKYYVRGLQPAERLLFTLRLVAHAWANLFVEGLVVLRLSREKSRFVGRALALFCMIIILWGLGLLTGLV